MRLLLDTHALLWAAVSEPARLPVRVRRPFGNAQTSCLSVPRRRGKLRQIYHALCRARAAFRA